MRRRGWGILSNGWSLLAEVSTHIPPKLQALNFYNCRLFTSTSIWSLEALCFFFVGSRRRWIMAGNSHRLYRAWITSQSKAFLMCNFSLLFCRQKAKCDLCIASDPERSHPIKHAIEEGGLSWQSPSLAVGEQYEYVTIDIDLNQVRTCRLSTRSWADHSHFNTTHTRESDRSRSEKDYILPLLASAQFSCKQRQKRTESSSGGSEREELIIFRISRGKIVTNQSSISFLAAFVLFSQTSKKILCICSRTNMPSGDDEDLGWDDWKLN